MQRWVDTHRSHEFRAACQEPDRTHPPCLPILEIVALNHSQFAPVVHPTKESRRSFINLNSSSLDSLSLFTQCHPSRGFGKQAMSLSSDVFVLTVFSLYGRIMLIFQFSSFHLCPVVSKKRNEPTDVGLVITVSLNHSKFAVRCLTSDTSHVPMRFEDGVCG